MLSVKQTHRVFHHLETFSGKLHYYFALGFRCILRKDAMEGPPSKHRNMAEEYRDFFHVDIVEVTKGLPKNKRKGYRGGVEFPFPVKLYRMLETTQKKGRCDIVSWQEHGRCFMLHQPAKFASDILPTYVSRDHCAFVATMPHRLTIFPLDQRIRAEQDDEFSAPA